MGPHVCLLLFPSTGLLAGYWEFPSVLVAEGSKKDEQWKQLQGEIAEEPLQGEFIGTVSVCVCVHVCVCVDLGEGIRRGATGEPSSK